jgi:hypothetical protein
MKVLILVIVGLISLCFSLTNPHIYAPVKAPLSRFDGDLKSTTFRLDPDPTWVNAKWDVNANEKYKAIRKEVDSATAVFGAQDKNGIWERKAKAAFDVWSQDHRNPFKLYKATSYIMAFRFLDLSFSKSKDNINRLKILNLGWSYIRKAPESYDYVRRGYLFNAGDEHNHKYGDLPKRLLQRDPYDRAVVVAMAYDYLMMKPHADYESLMFATFERASNTRQWKPWDYYYWGWALRMRGWKHGDKSSYNLAIKVLQKGIKATPSGFDSTWIRKYLDSTKAERDAEVYLKNKGEYLEDRDP